MRIYAPAKINLFLQVTQKREDGYHELLTLMCPIGLYDTLSLNLGVQTTTVSCTDPLAPSDESNLAYKAVDLFSRKLRKREHVNIFIDKHIPVGGGLGGGSSDAAAVLLALNEISGNPFSCQELMDMGLLLGADVPFFIFRKPAIATGIGEKLKLYDNIKPFKVLLVYPGFGISTAQVYKNLNLALTKCKKKINSSFFDKGEIFDAEHLCNDLETGVDRLYPDILEAKAELLEVGALGALMSGSGSTVFGLFSDDITVERACNSLSKNKRWKLYVAEMLMR